MATTRLCIVRHGETAWNAQRRIQGQLDVALNATGRAQARALGAMLAGRLFAALYASDLTRARQTAQAAAEALGLEVRLSPILRERHYGVFQGLTHEEARARHGDHYRRFECRDTQFSFGTGESLLQFQSRVMDGLSALARAHPGADVLVVSHGGILDIARRAATGMSLQARRDFPLPNAALNWLAYEDGAWQLLAWAQNASQAPSLDELAG